MSKNLYLIYLICCANYRESVPQCSKEPKEEVVVLEEIIESSGLGKSSGLVGSNDSPVRNLRPRCSLKKPEHLGQIFNAAEKDKHRAKSRQERLDSRNSKRHDQYIA